MHPKHRSAAVLLLFFVLSGHIGLRAQTNRYWPVNFDQESFLLAGAVVGGGSSLGSIYYNPASIAFIKQNKVSLNSSILAYTWYNFPNGLGEDLNIQASRISLRPPYTSFLFKPKRRPRLTIEMAIFTKEDQVINIMEGLQDIGNVDPFLEGEEVYDVLFHHNRRFKNLWFGAGMGYQLNDKLAVGVTNFVLVKRNYYFNLEEISVHSTQDSLFIGGQPVRYAASSFDQRQILRSLNFQLRWKFGITYKLDRGSLGLTLTTPSLNIYGKGDANYRLTSLNFRGEDGSLLDDILVADQATGLTTRYKDPFSIALGATIFSTNRRWEFYFTAEYFTGIRQYEQVSGRSNPTAGRPQTLAELGTDDLLTWFRGGNPVVNGAIGIKHELGNKDFIFFGLRTDFNYLENFEFGKEVLPVNLPVQPDFDVYHFTTGYQFRFLSIRGVMGVEYSLGRQEGNGQFLDADDPENNPFPPNFGLDNRNSGLQVRFNTLSLFLGLDISFGEKVLPVNK